MRKSQTQNISEIISMILKKNGLDNKLAEVRAIRAWEELLGRTVARYTRNLVIKDKTLYVSLNSSIVRNELLMIRDELIKRLNEKAGKQLIEKIVFK